MLGLMRAFERSRRRCECLLNDRFTRLKKTGDTEERRSTAQSLTLAGKLSGVNEVSQLVCSSASSKVVKTPGQSR